MKHRTFILSLAFVLIGGLVSTASALWPDDPLVNLVITDGPSDQVLPIPAVTSDGGCYFGWFDHSSGNYDVYLQRVDRNGDAQWTPNGILISSHPQNSWLVTWDMTVDAEDNAILVFADVRTGPDWDIYAYKISPAGEFLWGPNGVTLSDNTDYEPGAAVTVADDGDCVIVWSTLPDAGQATIQMQRLSPDGTERFAPGGLAIVSEPGLSPGFPDVIPADGGSVIVSWVKDMSTYYSDRHLRAERFASAGNSLWGEPTSVYDANPIPLGYQPRIQSDSNGGLVWAWHASEGNYHQARYQRLDAFGAEAYTHNGIKVTNLAGQHHIDPALAFDEVAGCGYVFWNERNAAQSQWGIYAQKVAPYGALEWGNNGHVLLPVSTVYRSFPRAVPCEGGAMVFIADEPTGAYGEDRLIGARVDVDGNFVWPGDFIEVSSLLSDKSRYPTVITGDDMAILVWEDNRGGTVDLYAQNVNLDGTLGMDPSQVNDGIVNLPIRLEQNSPNPFQQSTRFAITLTPDLMNSRLLVYDSSGRAIRSYRLPSSATGRTLIEWNGRDNAGAVMPGGVYYYQLMGPQGAESARRQAILIR